MNRKALPHDNNARYYDHVYFMSYKEAYKKMTAETLKVIGPLLQPNATIIDYGAGTGRMTIPLSLQGHRLIAVEVNYYMVNELWYKGGGNKIEIQNCSIADYKSDVKADMALAVFTVLNYILNEEELKDSLLNIFNHLKPGGYFLFDLPKADYFKNQQPHKFVNGNFERVVDLTPDPDSEDLFWYTETCKDFDWKYKELFKICNWDVNAVTKLLEKIGFEPISFNFTRLHFTGADYLLFRKGK